MSVYFLEVLIFWLGLGFELSALSLQSRPVLPLKHISGKFYFVWSLFMLYFLEASLLLYVHQLSE
jgi:hypothetical protein